jgi:hypothetical protein
LWLHFSRGFGKFMEKYMKILKFQKS